MRRCGTPRARRSSNSGRDNDELKQLVANLSLEVYRIKKTALPVPANDVGTNA